MYIKNHSFSVEDAWIVVLTKQPGYNVYHVIDEEVQTLHQVLHALRAVVFRGLTLARCLTPAVSLNVHHQPICINSKNSRECSCLNKSVRCLLTTTSGLSVTKTVINEVCILIKVYNAIDFLNYIQYLCDKRQLFIILNLDIYKLKRCSV